MSEGEHIRFVYYTDKSTFDPKTAEVYVIDGAHDTWDSLRERAREEIAKRGDPFLGWVAHPGRVGL